MCLRCHHTTLFVSLELPEHPWSEIHLSTRHMRRITRSIQSDGPNVFRRKRYADRIRYYTAPADSAHDRDHHISSTHCISSKLNEFVIVYEARVIRYESFDMDIVDPKKWNSRLF